MRMATIEEERRELWEGLLDGMRRYDDPDCAAACRRLLRHIEQTSVCHAGNPVRQYRRHGEPGGSLYKFTGTFSSKMFGGS